MHLDAFGVRTGDGSTSSRSGLIPIFRGATCVAILLFGLFSLRTAGANTPSVESCPGAAAWNRSHPANGESTQAQPDRAMSEPELLNDLKARVESDQLARKRWLTNSKSRAFASSVSEIDAANLTWLRNLLEQRGYPTAAQVGNEGVHLAWILLQHADEDPKLQSQLLPVLEQRYAAGELPANDLARISDRVLIASRKPQRYGTQFDWFSSNFKLPEPSRLREIDAEREKLGLMSLADYVCTIRAVRAKLK
jgi:hypothetical protein